MVTRIIVATVVLVIFGSGVASAQTPPVKNPSALAFTCPDHATDTGHEVDIINTATGEVIQTLSVGDPPLDANGEVVVAVNVQPVAFGAYRFVARALAGPYKGKDSFPSDAWERVPGGPSKPVVR